MNFLGGPTRYIPCSVSVLCHGALSAFGRSLVSRSLWVGTFDCNRGPCFSVLMGATAVA